MEDRIEAAPWLLGSEPEEAVPPDGAVRTAAAVQGERVDDIRAADEREA
jgi:hypothetical protein